MSQRFITVDGNHAVADVAYRASEVIAIYPITPASPMGEHSDDWATKGRANVWGLVPRVAELQSEGGAAGTLHGALQAGALATTFTSSQGLLLMIPNMYKIAGELTPCVIHVAARTLATHALSIFCDHSDVYAARGTGFAMLAASSVQEAQDLALVAHAATMASRVPFLHFFDGFRTSHEIAKIEPIEDALIRELVSDELIAAHRARALTPDKPVVRGTAQNPDTFFQARQAVATYYAATPAIVDDVLARFAKATGRHHAPVQYDGHPEAERVVVLMGSAAETARETARFLADRGERVGALTVRLFRPFPTALLTELLPRSVRAIAVLDRTMEPGAPGDPLYLDVVAALHEARRAVPAVVGGRYGLSSKELTPAMIKAVFDELACEAPKQHFTLGIRDDIGKTSLAVGPELAIEPPGTIRAVFWGLGADGTVGATKSTVEIIGDGTDLSVQGYFVYDSKKSGSVTESHLRFGPRPIRAPYLITQAEVVGCHQWSFLDRYDVLATAKPGGTVILNSPFCAAEVWDRLPREAQEQVVARNLVVWAIDAYAVARKIGLGRRINTIMQACFFALSGVLPQEQAIAAMKSAIARLYEKRGQSVVDMNCAAVDAAVAHLERVEMPDMVTTERRRAPTVSRRAPEFVQRVTAMMMARQGDLLPVSAFPPDGTWPTGTARWEKRGITADIPIWDSALCIQCNKCTLVCPHAAIRAKVYPDVALTDAPAGYKAVPFKSKDLPGHQLTIQVAPDDCTGCTLCVEVCPAHDKKSPERRALEMRPVAPLLAQERAGFEYFLQLPELPRDKVRLDVKHTQLLQPLFEFPGACAGCGETPYIKLLTQLFGDRVLIANATGCSSIFGGNLPTTPYAANCEGRGPAWANSLFEDNAEFGLGMRYALERNKAHARLLLEGLNGGVDPELKQAILQAEMGDEAALIAQRERVTTLREQLRALPQAEARRLETLADYLVDKSVWIVGGDGWAYDIGYGGLDHVLASGENVNILVLDTEVYSNTGGQQSKATPLGATAKFAAAGRDHPKKDLSLLAIAYGDVYVARIAFGADDRQTLRALLEAQSYPGTSLIIAYSHCIAHGYDMAHGLAQQELAVQSAYWPLFRFDPRRAEAGKPAMQLDSKAPTRPLAEFAYNELRFQELRARQPERAAELMQAAQQHAARRYEMYRRLTEP